MEIAMIILHLEFSEDTFYIFLNSWNHAIVLLQSLKNNICKNNELQAAYNLHDSKRSRMKKKIFTNIKKSKVEEIFIEMQNKYGDKVIKF
jgi:hypothetical protein